MKLVLTGDAQLAVHHWGERGGIPIVFWHALGPETSGVELADVAPVLASAGFHVIAVDGPGFGKSPLLPADRYASRRSSSCSTSSSRCWSSTAPW